MVQILCLACSGKPIYNYYLIERPDGVHMVHLETVDCPVCHPIASEDRLLLQGWTRITEAEYNKPNNDPSYTDLDV